MNRTKVALGMSGGVDSSVSAHLLVEQGYDVTGIYLECWRAPGCRTEEDRKDALKVALELNIPFKVLDFKQQYKDEVVEYFFNEYQAGRTPNPDVMCNKEIKFGMFYDWAMEHDFDYVATGHYANIDRSTEKPSLLIPSDSHKDQTYFLYVLTQEQLSHTLFPLGTLTKQQVREEAQQRNIHVASKKDSVGICFIGNINVHEFLKERLGENPGEVVDTDGNIIGSHNGLWFYTVGQRHGFTINKKTVVQLDDGSSFEKDNIPPFYVIAKKPKQNQLVVGFGSETTSGQFYVEQLHLIGHTIEELGKMIDLKVRIRHTGKLLGCTVKSDQEKESAEVTLDKPVQGIAAGQSAVFYTSNGECLGGGVVAATL